MTISSLNLSATPELEVFECEEEFITLTIWYRYDNELTKLYYQTLTEQLNKEIAELKSDGNLNRGKIHLEIMTAIWMEHSRAIEMYRFKDGYYCFINGLIQNANQEYLRKIIHYFSLDSWESFCYDSDLVEPNVAKSIFNKRMDKIKIKETYKPLLIKALQGVSIYYENDQINCKSANFDFDTLDIFIPFSHKGKDFIRTIDSIFVVENGIIINQTGLWHSDYGGWYDYKQSYKKWINFLTRGECYLSYNIPKNKFYILDPEDK